MAEILRELRELRKESQSEFSDTRASLTRLETSVGDLKERMGNLEQRTEEAEGRISAAEDASQRNERVLRYLLRREAALTNQCDDLQNRLRRNNLRIYQIPEGNCKIERAHRALGLKPADSNPPRSIIVRFLDYTVKEAVLRKAWMQKQVVFQGKTIYFDQDYSPEVQRKRARLRGVIKQLKDKGIQAKCRFPAQLRIDLESGVKTFPTLLDAVPMLEELGVSVHVSERRRWTRRSPGRRGPGGITEETRRCWVIRRGLENLRLKQAIYKVMF
ncbi:hypothetical protein WMY93_033456 [Mugilogobius chulae]|uniref:L1 transposable element RRM domain-containing protein n=1 Tax=Mugilogobius chulae TaxID=88201 RepID=A0AAW0ML54_9GOBI